jgi:hypothetical protein
MRFTVAVRTVSNAVPYTVAFLHSKNVMYVQEAGEISAYSAPLPLTCRSAFENGLAHVRIPTDL